MNTINGSSPMARHHCKTQPTKQAQKQHERVIFTDETRKATTGHAFVTCWGYYLPFFFLAFDQPPTPRNPSVTSLLCSAQPSPTILLLVVHGDALLTQHLRTLMRPPRRCSTQNLDISKPTSVASVMKTVAISLAIATLLNKYYGNISFIYGNRLNKY
ncbi:hypothetical protein Cgig2_032161 [Carnegiea gigantea]|uniref:Uncharacterized protein n=1 Tax=Carnegiea gigantea TaxID=171969 RepID=A0A9Q1JTF5_9CARY|nr:hypothetical protein Cgig2_032161 [Carnegiea gigantea]